MSSPRAATSVAIRKLISSCRNASTAASRCVCNGQSEVPLGQSGPTRPIRGPVDQAGVPPANRRPHAANRRQIRGPASQSEVPPTNQRPYTANQRQRVADSRPQRILLRLSQSISSARRLISAQPWVRVGRRQPAAEALRLGISRDTVSLTVETLSSHLEARLNIRFSIQICT
eukprot:1194596-Prorocentrum_minimum.AAC.3